MQPQSTLQRLDSQYDHETIVNGQTLHSNYSDVKVNQGIEMQDAGFQLQVKRDRLDSPGHNNETKVNNINSSSNYMLESQELHMGEFSLNANKSSIEVLNNMHNSTESVTGTVSDTVLTESCVAEGQNAYAVSKSVEVNLLDEKALLACIVRIIPPGSGGRIRISSTAWDMNSKFGYSAGCRKDGWLASPLIGTGTAFGFYLLSDTMVAHIDVVL
ncbi:hypothetical protein FXO38_10846 [Capsicum annuum]|nr:hypothetical protein FXO38_10846 [Capsicum annuum]